MLPSGEGHRFCLLRHASREVPFRGGVLYVHPFAEEMNKSRRAIAVTSRRLAAEGWSVLQIDLEGCGDSSGDFVNATWEGWQDDLRRAADWLRQLGIPLKVLWALRLGALPAAKIVDQLGPSPDLLLWQPVLSGRSHLTQFLRLKAAEEMIAQSGERGTVSRLRVELERGNAVEVAGYTLSPALAAAIDAASFEVPDRYGGQIHWFETGRSDEVAIAPASEQRIRTLKASGYMVSAQAVPGPSFWQTVEIEECPQLIESTVGALKNGQSEPVRL
jgi:exosortase A-associated hydrolase 2